MALKAGMSIAEAIQQLTRGFQKVMGRKPDGLEKIKIQQEAVQRLKELSKVVDMQGNVIDTSKGIMGGKQIQDSPEFGKKVRETYDAAKGPGKGQEMVDALKSPGAKKSYKIMEDQLGVKLYGDESFEEILEIQRTGKHPRGEPGSGITSESLKKKLMEGKNPFSDLVEETKKGPKTIEQRRKEAEEALKNKNVIPFKDPDKKADGGRAGFIGGGIAKGLAQQIIKKYKGKIDDKLLNQMLADDNPQRLAEVMATIDEALIMQNKGMGSDEIIGTIKSSLDRKKQATGGRAGFANGSPDAPSITLDAKGSRSGRQQIKDAPAGITSDEETFSAILKADIPVSEKIDLLSKIQYGKSRNRIEAGGQEIFLDEGGFKSRDIGLGFNKEAMIEGSDKEGLGGILMYNLETGEPEFNVGFKKKFNFAGGGRANFDKGGMSRRQFMKIMGGLAALPIVGKFFKGAKPAAKVAEVATKSMPAKPPEYFFDLAAKIKILGKESSVARRERMVEVNYKNYTLEEDLVTGDMTIVKRKGDPEFGYEEEVMALRKGQADEMTKGKKPPDEYEELTVRPDGDGKMKDVEDGIEPESIQEIVEEVGQGGGNLDQTTLEEIARGRLASGGVAMMLGE